jgi:hypothetical protein
MRVGYPGGLLSFERLPSTEVIKMVEAAYPGAVADLKTAVCRRVHSGGA